MSLAQKIIDDLDLSAFSLSELKIYLVITRKMKNKYDIVSMTNSELAELTGMCKRGCIRPIKSLCRKKLLFASYKMKNNVPKKLYSLEPFENKQLLNGVMPNTNKDKKTFDFPGYVYLIQADLPNSPCKIGKSINIPDRMKTFEIKLPFDFEIIHTIECRNYHYAEKMLHTYYSNKRINGEWFDLDDNDIREIKSIKILK